MSGEQFHLRTRTSSTYCSNSVAVVTTETARDGTVWNVCLPSIGSRGRLHMHYVLRQVSGPTSFAKQRVRQDSFLTFNGDVSNRSKPLHLNTRQMCLESDVTAKLSDAKETKHHITVLNVAKQFALPVLHVSLHRLSVLSVLNKCSLFNQLRYTI